MTSLAKCLEQIKDLSSTEKNRIALAAKEYREKGYSEKEAEICAVNDALKDLDKQEADITGEVSKVQKEAPIRTETKEKAAQPEKPTPGRAWIKDQWRPFTEWREVTKGRNKGKVEIVSRGTKVIVSKDQVKEWPGAPTGEKAPVKEAEGKVGEKVEVKETAKGPVVSADLTKKEEGKLTPKQQKEYLLAEIDKAIEQAPEQATDDPKRHWVKIIIPGDGKFTILNMKESLEIFKKNAKAWNTKNAPAAISVGPTHKELNQRVDDAIDMYGEAGKAADIIEKQGKQLELDEKEQNRLSTLISELRNRAEVTSVPEDQKSDRFKNVEEQVRAENYKVEQSKELQRKEERRVRAA